jgi:flagellar hook protein FlgE
MSLVGALYVGSSGLDASSTELSVVGDNISNSATVGFKSARVVFADTMAQQLIGSTGQLGVGVTCETVQKLFSQGDFTTTGLATDVAIEGDGLFVVKGDHNGENGTFYTRNGQFTIDKNGYLTDQEGLKVQGLQADANGTVTSGLLGDLQVGNASAPAKATDSITIRGNLDQTAVAPAWDVTNPKTTSNFTTSMTVYDSLGNAIQLNVYFCKNDAASTASGDSGDWTYHVMTDGANVSQDVAGATTTAGTAAEVASGTLQFGQDGSLISNLPINNNFCPNNAKSPQQLTFNFGTGTGDTPSGSGLDGLTQYSATSAVSFVTQAGSTSGSLSTISIGQDGVITGSFTNGQTRTLGQLVIANFQAPDQLGRVGATLYTEQPTSGSATIGTPATADRGSITAGTLEQSNVDISNEFVRMIAAQRNFEANSKVLTTADQLLGELMQLKR